MSDHDNAPMSRDEVRERYGWKEGEREQSEREMAERQARIDAADQLLARARAAKPQQHDVVTKDCARTRTHRPQASAPVPAAAAPTAVTAAWANYVGRQIDARQRNMMKAVAGVLVEEEKQREQLARDVVALRERVTTLEAELAELRAAANPNVKRIRTLPASDQSSMIA